MAPPTPTGSMDGQWAPGSGVPAPWLRDGESSDSDSEHDWWNLPWLDSSGPAPMVPKNAGATNASFRCWSPFAACTGPPSIMR